MVQMPLTETVGRTEVRSGEGLKVKSCTGHVFPVVVSTRDLEMWASSRRQASGQVVELEIKT